MIRMFAAVLTLTIMSFIAHDSQAYRIIKEEMTSPPPSGATLLKTSKVAKSDDKTVKAVYDLNKEGATLRVSTLSEITMIGGVDPATENIRPLSGGNVDQVSFSAVDNLGHLPLEPAGNTTPIFAAIRGVNSRSEDEFLLLDYY